MLYMYVFTLVNISYRHAYIHVYKHEGIPKYTDTHIDVCMNFYFYNMCLYTYIHTYAPFQSTCINHVYVCTTYVFTCLPLYHMDK